MKLYHLSVPTDLAGASLVVEHSPVVKGVGGTIELSRSFGIGAAVLVVSLPDNVQPADVGLAEAVLVEQPESALAPETGNL